ncbi:MAG: DUF1294 domain-containing protein [Caldilineaceae bacterium]|nr:DUF1294 domain-containing protein [Caldilineaceae bacterium]
MQAIVNVIFSFLMVALGIWIFTGTTLPFYPAWLLALGIVTFLFYGFDKYRAQRKQWRVSESTLNSLTLAGGFLGAWGGMLWFRHKTKDTAVKRWLWISTLLHIGLLYFGIVSVG